jgi:uncharacterized OsmC-like protein
MAAMAKIKYLGALRAEWTHLASGAKIISDAPVDNKGKGESFSPTDLCSASLAGCILTIMGIYAQEHNINIDGATAEVTKNMLANPRKIGSIEIVINMPDREYSEKEKKSLIRAADSCPVRLTLEGVEQKIEFNWAK